MTQIEAAAQPAGVPAGWRQYFHQGPIWTCAIGLPGDPASRVVVNCLIDTGAEHTHVEPSLCRRLGATPIARGESLGLHSSEQVNLSRLDISVPTTTGTALLFQDSVIFENTTGPDRQFDVIIGRDILRFFTFTLDGPRGLFRLEGRPSA